MQFTQEQLESAFKLVQNKEHWKNPIESYCTSDEVAVVAAAVEHFTATQAYFNYIRPIVNPNTDDEETPVSRFKVGEHILKVRADGYRKGPAGDH